MLRQASREVATTTPWGSALAYPLMSVLCGYTSIFGHSHLAEVSAATLALLILGVLRIWLGKRYLATKKLRQELRQLQLFRFSIWATAAVWGGFAGFVVYQHPQDLTGYSYILCTIGLIAGASYTLIPDRISHSGYLLAMLVPSLLALVSKGLGAQLFTAGIVLLFLIFSWVSAGHQRRRHLQFLQQRQDFVIQAQKLEAAQDELRRALAQEQEQHRLLTEQNQALLIARRSADSSNRAKSHFLASMSHEIRTPMNAIVGLSDLLLDTSLTDTQRNWLSTINSSCNSLLTLISDILDLSKIEAGRMELLDKTFIPQVLAQEVLDLMRPIASQKNIELKSRFDEKLQYEAQGDAQKIRQVLLNLVGNAVKFTRKGGVAVIADYIPGESESAFRVRFRIQDTGIGIPEKKLSSIFEAFTQVDGSTTRKYSGTGLGLAISRQLVELLGGCLWVESSEARAGVPPADAKLAKPTVGSVFWVEIPLRRAGETPASKLQPEADSSVAPTAASPLIPEGTRILVAEDNPVNQRVIVAQLERFGQTVELVETGKAALEACRDQGFDIVLMDLQMPELDGLEATRQIRKLDLPDRPWIIALTANAFEEDRKRCLAAGMDDYLSKPLRRQHLAQALTRYTQSKGS